MKEDLPGPLATSRGKAALAFLIGGAVGFIAIFLDEEGRSIVPYIGMLIQNPKRIDVDDAIVISTLLTLGAVAVASPMLLKWLPVSRMMRMMLRVFSGLPASVFLYLCVKHSATNDPILLLLIISPALTFIGLLLVKPLSPPELSP